MEEKDFAEKLQINIGGMSCQSCERRIKTALSKLTGVNQVEVSYKDGTAEVDYDQRLTTKNDLFLVISKLGYTVTGDSQNSQLYPLPEESKPVMEIKNTQSRNGQSEKITIHISGMHCKSCEMRIEDHFMSQDVVINASADFKNGTLDLIFDQGYSLNHDQIKKLVETIGYSVGKGTTKPTIISKNPRDYQDLGIALVILLALYAIIKTLGIGDLVPSTTTKSFSLPIILLIGITAGFSTCMALVGGLVLGISAKMSEANPDATPAEKFRPHLFFCSGRILSYIILGGMLGMVGSIFQFSSFSLGLLTIIIGGVMLIMGVQLLDIFPWANRLKFALPKSVSRKFGSSSGKKYSHGNAMVLGALTFFLPCGFTQAMQVYAIGTGNFVDGALTMGAFVIGTIPGLMGIGGLSSIVKGALARRFFKFAGLVVVCFAFFNISNGMGLSGLSLPQANKNIAAQNDPNVKIEKGIQVVRMKEVEKGYFPQTFSIRSGVPVKWIIDAEAPMSCAASFVVPKLNIRKTLTAGENVINFTPDKPGVLKFSCSMGMYTGTFYIVNPATKDSAVATIENEEDDDEMDTGEPAVEFSTAILKDTVQYVTSVVNENGYQPIIVKKDIPVHWTISADSAALNPCNSKIKIPDLNIVCQLKPGKTTVRFTAHDTGDIEFTCSMNMIKSTIRVTDSLVLKKNDVILKLSAINPFIKMAMGGCCSHGKTDCCQK